jgi:hypothetical protein
MGEVLLLMALQVLSLLMQANAAALLGNLGEHGADSVTAAEESAQQLHEAILSEVGRSTLQPAHLFASEIQQLRREVLELRVD